MPQLCSRRQGKKLHKCAPENTTQQHGRNLSLIFLWPKQKSNILSENSLWKFPHQASSTRSRWGRRLRASEVDCTLLLPKVSRAFARALELSHYLSFSISASISHSRRFRIAEHEQSFTLFRVRAHALLFAGLMGYGPTSMVLCRIAIGILPCVSTNGVRKARPRRRRCRDTEVEPIQTCFSSSSRLS
jgi:hypothetical protein